MKSARHRIPEFLSGFAQNMTSRSPPIGPHLELAITSRDVILAEFACWLDGFVGQVYNGFGKFGGIGHPFGQRGVVAGVEKKRSSEEFRPSRRVWEPCDALYRRVRAYRCIYLRVVPRHALSWYTRRGGLGE